MDVILLGMLQQGAEVLKDFDALQALLLGNTGLTVWLIWDCIRLRQENTKLNAEARETARSSIEAMVRLATERKP
jgi:hypothetical protein